MDSLRNDAVEKAMNSGLVIFVGGLNKNHFQDCEGGDPFIIRTSFCAE